MYLKEQKIARKACTISAAPNTLQPPFIPAVQPRLLLEPFWHSYLQFLSNMMDSVTLLDLSVLGTIY